MSHLTECNYLSHARITIVKLTDVDNRTDVEIRQAAIDYWFPASRGWIEVVGLDYVDDPGAFEPGKVDAIVTLRNNEQRTLDPADDEHDLLPELEILLAEHDHAFVRFN